MQEEEAVFESTFMIGKLKHRQKQAYLYIMIPVSVSGFKNKWSSYAYDVTALFQSTF